jgi:hypothetical protein
MCYIVVINVVFAGTFLPTEILLGSNSFRLPYSSQEGEQSIVMTAAVHINYNTEGHWRE